ncbi:hypothetical protein [Cellulomonas sp. Root137]|nr:hypothetical protein [Cellulomonas sp. Root137]
MVPGTVERMQGEVVLRISAPWPTEVAGWLAAGARIVDGVAATPGLP